MKSFLLSVWNTEENRSYDRVFLYLLFTLLFIGVSVMYASSSISADREFGNAEYFLEKQIVWTLLGLVGFFVTASIPFQKLERFALPFLIFSILLLFLVFIPGLGKSVSTSYGRSFHRWISLGPFQLQPSEVAKISVLLYLSSFFCKMENAYRVQISTYALPVLLLLTVIVLILVEPAFGTTLEILFVIVVFVFLHGFPLRNLLMLGISSVPLIYILIEKVGYRKKRIEVWLDPYKYRFDEGHQLVSSYRAFQDGGWFGLPLASGYAHRYLTYSHTDFVMATFVEDFGFFGFLVFFFLVLIFLFRCFYLLRLVREPFGRYLGAGILCMLGIQFLINLYVVTGLFPITGISLPFFSYGGSSILVLLGSLGILANITRRENLAV